MPEWLFRFLVKVSPTFVVKQRMRFFGILSIENFKSVGVRNERVEELLNYCRFWAREALKRNPNDDEAKKFVNFPDSYPKRQYLSS